MKIQLADIIDKASILQIKLDNGLDVKDEYDKIMQEIPDDAKDVFEELYQVNKKIWTLEAMIGNMALQSRAWNKRRSYIKNRITSKYGGYYEHKKYRT